MNLTNEWIARWPHFKPEEILSDDQLTLLTLHGVMPYSFRALDKLEQFRNQIVNTTKSDAVFIVNYGESKRRGARSLWDAYEVNRQQKGESKKWAYTFHLWCAFDLTVPEMTTKELFDLALKSKLWGGIGLYNTWVHVDDRDHFGDVTTWDLRTSK